jgi:uncharacterized protein YbjT (DUF2867 family)
MANHEQRRMVVTGATGLQGGAVARHLLREGWRVQALTRNPQSAKALALAALGAEVVQGDMAEPASLQPIFAGAYGVYSVQTPYIDGPEAEVRQGKHVAEVAKAAGVQHFVYASAGSGQKGTGIPSWESKLQIEDQVRALGLPFTIVRPTAFMELMTDKKFFPNVAAWHLMPKLIGPARELPWLCTDDLGVIVANVFADPERFIGRDLKLASERLSLEACRTAYRTVMGKNPSRFPMPVWLFERFGFAGKDLPVMWRWLATGVVEAEPEATRAIHPGALSVEAWLQRQKA